MKRIIAAFLTAFMILCGVSCGRGEKKVRVTNVYRSAALDVGDFIADGFVTSKDFVVAYGHEPGRSDVVLKIDNRTRGVTREEIGGDRFILGAAVMPDGSVVILSGRYDEELKSNVFALTKNGETIAKPDGNPRFIAADGEGNLVVSDGESMTVYDSSMNRLFDAGCGRTLERLSGTSDGRVFAVIDGKEYGYFDLAARGFDWESKLSSGGRILPGAGFDYCRSDQDGIYGHGESGEVKLLDYVNSDLIVSQILDLSVIDQDRMIARTFELSDGEEKNSLIFLERIPDDEVPAKFVLRLAHGDTDVSELAVRFNRQSEDYRIELADYRDFGENSPSDALENDFLTGNAPDIVLAADFENLDILSARGAFADFSELLSDSERREFLPGLLEAFTDGGGRIYELVTNFTLESLYTASELTSWDVADYVMTLDGLSDAHLFMYEDQSTILSVGLMASLDSFVDRAAGECDFDSELFRSLLEAAGRTKPYGYQLSLSGDDLKDYEENRAGPFIDGKVLIDRNGAYGFADFLHSTVLFGDRTKAVGYPTGSGNGTLIHPLVSYSINKRSEHTAGALEFVKFAAGIRLGNAFPASRELTDAMFLREEGRVYYFTYGSSRSYDAGVTLSEARGDIAKNHQAYGIAPGGEFILVDSSCRDAFLELVKGASAYPTADMRLLMMIFEEAQIYFAGEKSLDETVKIINDRVSTYLSERK